MAGQDQFSQAQSSGASSQQGQHEDEVIDDLPAPTPDATQAQAQTAGVDDLLAEIDGVLESNAEEFVRGFVQKGGQ
ncbi:ubiquitin-like protein Pup [Psychromicrobium xiongbiense]|uniref:ubiquitin-like protein Pup n=1 Tax=Psychromicrobium xiongbiense TaxID=3051184 RepID=UPI0025547A9C|nr:ubiquitin-like protein Pup [Psychromicrobium sp. YIM S02556]